MSGTSLGIGFVLVLLAFVGWTGYRAASVGGACLLLAGVGLVLQETVGWMPADREAVLSYQLGVVVVAAAVAIPFGLRRRLDGVGGIVVALVFALAALGASRFADPDPALRVVLGALTAALVLIALHIFAEVRVLRPYAAVGTYLPIRRLCRGVMLTALAGILVNAASLLAPHLWLALGLLFLSFTCFVVASQLATFVVILVRNGAFAKAWARRWSRTRRAANTELVGWGAAGAGALTMLGIPVAVPDVLRPPTPVTVALLVLGAGCVVAGGEMLRRILDRAASHRYGPEPPESPQVASALRGLVESEPVYRLLPGIARRW
ncbi:hypothetical protein C6361_07705 [Plantactinospora sp. BC1]|uniref:hypothetical protein n=1 Tax=Plantactinospora sp. BC1 TaxID=2108470 RepID=UPI000D15BD20|nr:hypothetical protein [Plantactinospora sp. BC1]AVT29395.1 hypothetical protein C6361_07705 [Plantactinospora sp. BC1]